MHEKWSAGIWCTMTVFVFGTSRRRISTAQTQNACTTVINNIPIKHWVVPSSWSMAKSTNRWSTLRTPGLNYSSTTLQQQTLFKHLPYTYSHDKNMSTRCRWNVSWIKCPSVQNDINCENLKMTSWVLGRHLEFLERCHEISRRCSEFRDDGLFLAHHPLNYSCLLFCQS